MFFEDEVSWIDDANRQYQNRMASRDLDIIRRQLELARIIDVHRLLTAGLGIKEGIRRQPVGII